MNPEGWARVDELFSTAVELPTAAVSAFLDAECPDPEMRAELESLLAYDASPGAGIEEPIEREAQAMATEAAEWLIGRHIGPYRVTGIAGEGGMGAVYSAVRDDDQYSKQVAIKLVRHGFETDRLLERFRAERQILAALEHPYIPRMLDGGATPDGFPYLVMELVEGVPITEYVRREGLSIEAALRLFQKVCEAVQYAHANLVVHRDIKPSNIQVTRDGTPKLLDFGIARLLTADPGGEASPASTVLLTPDYASPEQVLGHPVSTATDIYSLGAVLYELLTGAPPHRVAGQTHADTITEICTKQPDLPSKRVRHLAGDLDNIVLMALRKEPERRYRSVEQFSEDIRRHLDGRPVIARADTVAYRAGKFVVRNRWAIAAAAAVVLALGSGIVMARREAAREQRRFAQVRQLAGKVLFEIDGSIRPLAGSTPSRQLIMKSALEYLRSLSAEATGDATLLDELAAAYRRVADIQGGEYTSNLGDPAAALDAYRRGVALARSAVALQPANNGFNKTLGGLLLELSKRQFGSSQVDAARASITEAVRTLERCAANRQADDGVLETLADAYSVLGNQLSRTGDPTAAAEAKRNAVDVFQKLVDRNPSADHRDGLASAWHGLAVTFTLGADAASGKMGFEKAIAIRETLARDFPANADYKRGLMVSYGSLAESTRMSCSSAAGPAVEQTRPFSEKAVTIARDLARADPKNNLAQVDLGQALARIACLEQATGHPDAAAADYDKALEVTRTESLGASRSILILRVILLRRSGNLLRDRGNFRDAAARYREAVHVAHDLSRREPNSTDLLVYTVGAPGDLASALGRLGDRAAVDELVREAEPELQKALRAKLPPGRRVVVPATMFRFGEGYAFLHHQPASCLWLRRSAAEWKEIESAGPIPPDFTAVHTASLRLVASCPSTR